MSALMIDSNVLLWWATDDARLARDGVRDRLANADRLCVSVVSPWELWIKAASGRLELDVGFADLLNESHGLDVLPPALDDARTAAFLPPVHGDPFDRMIVAQAINAGLTLVTSDAKLGAYPVPTLLVSGRPA